MFLPSSGILLALNAVAQMANEWCLPTEKELYSSPLHFVI